jgi:hypothetical protein
VPPGARACPDCGADERTGWNEEKTRYDGLDLPAEPFDDEDMPNDAHLKPRNMRKMGPTLWWLVGIGVLLLFVLFIVTGHPF